MSTTTNTPQSTLVCPQCGSADFRLMRLETNIVEHLIDDEGYVDFSEYLKVYPDDTLDHWLHCNVCGEDFEPVMEPHGETGYTEAADRVVGVGAPREGDEQAETFPSINLLGWYQQGEEMTQEVLKAMSRDDQFRFVAPLSYKTGCIVTYGNTWFEMFDNGGEIEVGRINSGELYRSVPSTRFRESMTTETMAYRLLAALRDLPIDYDLKIPHGRMMHLKFEIVFG